MDRHMLNNLSNNESQNKKFPEIFSGILKKYNYTTYALAEKSGVERTILVKMQKYTRTQGRFQLKTLRN